MPRTAPRSTSSADNQVPYTMPTSVVMPQMGESIAEGTIVRWNKNVGDTVDRDEPLFEISTDKVDAEIPSPVAGVLLKIIAREGETVPVDSVVALIGAPGETLDDATATAGAGRGGQPGGSRAGRLARQTPTIRRRTRARRLPRPPPWRPAGGCGPLRSSGASRRIRAWMCRSSRARARPAA